MPTSTFKKTKPTMTMSQADLVIVVRKGGKQAINPTVDGQSPNDRPVIVQATDNTIRIGGQQGRSPDAAQNGGPLYKTNPDQCCFDRKVTVLRRAAVGFDAWMSGIRIWYD